MHPPIYRIAAILTLSCVAAAPADALTYTFASASQTRIATETGSGFENMVESDVNIGGTTASISDTFADGSTGRNFAVSASSSLASGSILVRNTGTGGPGPSTSTSVLDAFGWYMDTLTFTGNFSNYMLPFQATLDGIWSAPSTPVSTQDQQFIGAIRFDDASNNSLQDGDFAVPNIYFSRPGELYSDIEFLPLAQSTNPTPVSIDLSGVLTLNGVNPSVHAWFFMQTAFNSINPNAVWDGNFENTGTLRFDFTGLDVISASGVYPGTPPSAQVPEPGTLLLLAGGLAGVALFRRRAGRTGRQGPLGQHLVGQ